jgi:hypothetical protein
VRPHTTWRVYQKRLDFESAGVVQASQMRRASRWSIVLAIVLGASACAHDPPDGVRATGTAERRFASDTEPPTIAEGWQTDALPDYWHADPSRGLAAWYRTTVTLDREHLRPGVAGRADQVDAAPVRQPEVGDEHVGRRAREERPPLLARRARAEQPELRVAADRPREALARVVVVLDEDDALLRHPAS